MFSYLLILFTVLPALELYVLLKVGSHIGAANTLLVILFTGVAGAYLARLQGFLVLQKIQTNLSKGVIPNSELLDGLMILVGGIVLLTPGFITDTLGLMLLIPFTRSLIKSMVRTRFEKMVKEGRATHTQSTMNHDKGNYTDIDI